MPLAGDGTDATSVPCLDATLRDDVVPATFGKVPGAEAYVGGNLAFSRDFQRPAAARDGPGRASSSVLPSLLMLVAFRSVTIAAVSVVLNVLSMAAAFRRHGRGLPARLGASLVGGRGVGAIESWIPLFTFVILFGLSMDYHVFVVSRIRRAHDRGLPTRRGRPRRRDVGQGRDECGGDHGRGLRGVRDVVDDDLQSRLGVGLARRDPARRHCRAGSCCRRRS